MKAHRNEVNSSRQGGLEFNPHQSARPAEKLNEDVMNHRRRAGGLNPKSPTNGSGEHPASN